MDAAPLVQAMTMRKKKKKTTMKKKKSLLACVAGFLAH